MDLATIEMEREVQIRWPEHRNRHDGVKRFYQKGASAKPEEAGSVIAQ
jgi:hypothetical protein